VLHFSLSILLSGKEKGVQTFLVQTPLPCHTLINEVYKNKSAPLDNQRRPCLYVRDYNSMIFICQAFFYKFFILFKNTKKIEYLNIVI